MVQLFGIDGFDQISQKIVSESVADKTFIGGDKNYLALAGFDRI